MAKRKRLTPPEITQQTISESDPSGLETKSIPRYPLGVHPAVPSAGASSRPPIAQVAGDASAQAALDEVTAELSSARSEGRLVQNIPLEAIKADHLIRDRLTLDEGEMAALKASLTARGQQTPIEVVDLGQGSYGLISGWRRLTALKDLHAETGEARFAQIQGLVKPIDSVSDSYVAMVEENEIRANLSYYERARLAAEAAELGIYPNPQRAVQALFASASSSKRSKIISFLLVHRNLDSGLFFPAAIPERLGLALAAAIEKDRFFGFHLTDTLRKIKPKTARDERAIIDRALKRAAEGLTGPLTGGEDAEQGGSPPKAREVAPGIKLEARKGRVVLSGKGVTDDLQDDLAAWLAKR